MKEERRSSELDSPVWLAISEYKLLSEKISDGLEKLVRQAIKRCGCSAGVFVLLREPLPEMRLAIGYTKQALTPDSLFVLAAEREGLLLIENASQDQLSKACPEIVEANHPIRLFASVAVKAPNGVVIGVLSVFDHHPRAELADAKPELLASFGLVFDQFLQRRAQVELEDDTGLLGRSVFEKIFIDEWRLARSAEKEVNWLVVSLPMLGRVTKQFGAEKAEHAVALLAQLIRQKFVMSRQILGRISGSSVGVFLPERFSDEFLGGTIEAVRGELVARSNVMLESAAVVFRLSPAMHPTAEPEAILRAMERITARRKDCRHERLTILLDENVRELKDTSVKKNKAAISTSKPT